MITPNFFHISSSANIAICTQQSEQLQLTEISLCNHILRDGSGKMTQKSQTEHADSDMIVLTELFVTILGLWL